jgi:hypothetical protein
MAWVATDSDFTLTLKSSGNLLRQIKNKNSKQIKLFQLVTLALQVLLNLSPHVKNRTVVVGAQYVLVQAALAPLAVGPQLCVLLFFSSHFVQLSQVQGCRIFSAMLAHVPCQLHRGWDDTPTPDARTFLLCKVSDSSDFRF